MFPHRSVPESRLPPGSSGLVHGQPAVWQHQSVFLVLHLLDSALHRQNRKDISIRIWTAIISDQSVDGDALSTTCFALGLEDGMKLAESLDDVQAFFVTSDYEIHYTRDFQKKIKVTETE